MCPVANRTAIFSTTHPFDLEPQTISEALSWPKMIMSSGVRIFMQMQFCSSVFSEGDVVFVNSDLVMQCASFGDFDENGICVVGHVLDLLRPKTFFSSYYKPRLMLSTVPLVNNKIIAAPSWCNEAIGLLVVEARAQRAIEQQKTDCGPPLGLRRFTPVNGSRLKSEGRSEIHT